MSSGLIQEPLIISLLALMLAALLTPIVRRLAVVTGTVDRPAARKIHLAPIPLLGGLAIYAGFTLALIGAGDQSFLTQLAGMLIGATLVSAVGALDDRWGLNPWIKLGSQLLAGVTLILSGVQVQSAPWPWLNWAITLVWVAGITNALNLLDNMNGLSAGLAAVAAAFFFVLAALSGQYLVAPFAAALLGASLGFLRYNFRDASIFMGDSGSLFIGFVLAALAIKLRFANSPDITWLIPVLVLGVPIFDTTLVTLSRLRRGLNPLTSPGQDHVSHRLVATGMTQREAVLTLYLASGALGLVALYLLRASRLEGIVVLLLLTLAFVLGLMHMERILVPGAKAEDNHNDTKHTKHAQRI
ncbi:MAG TPA: MraY family glycosyltransferase [Dehalococcoidia bacterium]|nr:MraY family glycosyltransferase [Dehalococcoidia bacterium]